MEIQLKKESAKGQKLKALECIAAKLKQGGKYSDFEKELNKVLGTELKERDLEAEGDWEHYNKGTESGIDGKGK